MDGRELAVLLSRSAAGVALLVLSARAASAQAVHDVPGDFATIQEAIDAAADGDVIRVHGGTHEAITIDRPLALVGEPRFSIHPPFDSGFRQPPAVQLAGRGGGAVALCNLEVGGPVNGFFASESSPGIDGGGFDELHLQDCAVDGPFWVFLTGVGIGSPALRSSIAEILIVDSTLRGSNTGADSCIHASPAGPVGIQAPGSVVTLVDSTVDGGGTLPLCGPGVCPTGGAGGTGIVARETWSIASRIRGGRGALYFPDPSFAAPCGAAPDGLSALGVRRLSFAGDLKAAGAPRLGDTWQLSWQTSGAPSALLVASVARPTPFESRFGPLFLESASVFLARVSSAGSDSHDLEIPPDRGLLGRTLAAQVFAPAAGLTRPLVEIVRP